MWGDSVVHSHRWDYGCNMGESGGVFKWLTKMGEMLVVIWVNQVG